MTKQNTNPDAKHSTKCPAGLSASARKHFKTMEAILTDVGYRPQDSAALVAYLEAYALMKESKEKIAETGGLVVMTPNGQMQINPWHSIYKQNSELLKKWTAELGLSPGSRKRLGMRAENDDNFTV
ncbi:MAG: phage terminase small subunit P27 family [Candidatus Sumerlaeales bacterium]|nr:phage terminase small subunit P27 family [Candidatus Sumerlaeales bacterium]